MNEIRIFPDTNALVSMLCFPRPQHGKLPLAHEVADAEAAGECTLLIAEVVAEELREVVRRAFPQALPELEPFLKSYGVKRLPRPDKVLLEQVGAVCHDPDDVPILIAAVMSAQQHGVTHLLSNDIETFHTPAMKRFLEQHGLVPVTLFGLLKLLGRR